MVPEALDPARILTVGALIDKYDCMKATKYMARIWTHPHLQIAEPSKLNELLRATLYFNDKYLFEGTCKSIIWSSVGSINNHPGPNPELNGLRSVLGTISVLITASDNVLMDM